MSDPRPDSASPPPRRREPLALASLAAIALLVALVSLPSLRGLALRQNESDALRLVRALQQAAVEELAGAPLPATAAELLARAALLRHRFGDLQPAGVPESPRLLRCHGYLFDLVPAAGGVAARAWPWEHGSTGFAAFVRLAGGEQLAHANTDGTWSGPASPPHAPWSAASGWRELR